MNGFLRLAQSRRMTRQFLPDALPDEAVETLLEAATRAPSPHNRQPWRFVVVTDGARLRLADAMGDRLIADLKADGAPDDVAAADAARSRQRIATAPVSILACLTMADMDRYPDARRNDAERWMAGQAVAAAIENLLLQAEDRGLGACWMCAPLFCPDTVRATLDLPADWEPQALVTLGYPASRGQARGRAAPSTVTVRRNA